MTNSNTNKDKQQHNDSNKNASEKDTNKNAVMKGVSQTLCNCL